MARIVFLAVVLGILYIGAYGAHLPSTNGDRFPLSIIHVNDFHARYEETNELAGNCKAGEKCIGGFARMVTTIKQLKEELADTNPIFLNAGDNFQGTLWYSIGRWKVTTQFMNMLDADAVTLGNHEFDRGVAEAVKYMENLNAPVVVANIDDSEEPEFQGKYQKSITIDKYGRKIGVIGAIVQNTYELAHSEKLKFLDESEVIRKEAELLKQQGVDIIIALTHCGLDVDYKIAKATAPYVDVIVGGHSHTFMYTQNETHPAPGTDTPRDDYPAVVEANGHRVLIVQAASYAKYVGNLTVWFNAEGNVDSWEGAPVYLDTHIAQDPEVMAAILPWKKIIDAKGKSVIGISKVVLDKSSCNAEECNLGNFVADAMVHHHMKHENTTKTIVGIIGYGEIRTSINKGTITYSDLSTTLPFEGSMDILELKGEHMKEMFEHAVKEYTWQSRIFLHVSGAKIVYNMSRPAGERVVSLEILDHEGIVPQYKPIDLHRYYKCSVTNFIADGGDGFSMVPSHRRNHERGPIDIDVMVDYVKAKQVIHTGVEGRIKFIGGN